MNGRWEMGNGKNTYGNIRRRLTVLQNKTGIKRRAHILVFGTNNTENLILLSNGKTVLQQLREQA